MKSLKEVKNRLTIDLIQKLLQGIKLEFIENDIKVTILPPQEGRFITYEELEKIIRDKTNMTEKLLKLMKED